MHFNVLLGNHENEVNPESAPACDDSLDTCFDSDTGRNFISNFKRLSFYF
jgi:hypothetical protein